MRRLHCIACIYGNREVLLAQLVAGLPVRIHVMSLVEKLPEELTGKLLVKTLVG